MKKSSVQCVALLAAAGLACSMASAQTKGQEAHIPANVSMERLSPAYIEYGGVRYPYSSSSTDVIQVIYENGAIPFPGALGGYFFTGTLPRWHTLDQVSFNPGPGQGGGRPLTSMTFAIGTTTAGLSTAGIDILVKFWDTLTPAATPATSAQIGGEIRLNFAAPAGGWADNTVYISNPIDLTTFGLTTADDQIFVDMAYVTVGGTSPANAHPFGTTPFYSNTGPGHTVGSSLGTFWRDANGDGVIGAGEERSFAAPLVGNYALALSGDAPALSSGACCLPDGTCVEVSAPACTTQFGTYNGDNSLCVNTTCATPGACCLIDGSCIQTNAAFCTARSGTFSGAGTSCGPCTQPPALIYKNGPLSTGSTTQSGVAAPAGAAWSEVANNAGEFTISNTNAGYGVAGTNRLADDFVVDSPSGWRIDSVMVKAYQTGSTSSLPTITGATLRIWNGNPASGGTVVFGDTTTNRFQGAVFSGIYRCFNTIVAAVCGGATTAPDTSRPLMDVYINAGGTVLPPGTYWIDYSISGSLGSGPFVPAVTVAGTRQPVAASNAQQFTTMWAPITDAGQGCTPTALAQEANFWLRGAVLGGGPACYANCDNSTNTPCLNVQDFGCFLNAFSNNSSYANCDGSTNIPVLNVQDFGCFLNAFSNGCSSCI